jgi:hypothetical protein
MLSLPRSQWIQLCVIMFLRPDPVACFNPSQPHNPVFVTVPDAPTLAQA